MNKKKKSNLEKKIKKENKIGKLAKKIKNPLNKIKLKKIKGFIETSAWVGGTLSLLFGGMMGICYLMNKTFYQKSSYNPARVYASEMDGPFSYTELDYNSDGSIEIERNSVARFFGSDKIYVDNDGDLKVDKFEISGSESIILHRNKHLKKNVEKFQEIDKEFQEQLERFKPYIEKWKNMYEQD